MTAKIETLANLLHEPFKLYKGAMQLRKYLIAYSFITHTHIINILEAVA